MAGRPVDLRAFDPLSRGTVSPQQRQQEVADSRTHAIPPNVPLTRPPGFDTKQIQFLEQQGFSSGLIQALAYGRQYFPRRIWILDNSASMNVRDSHRISGTFDDIKNEPVSRWEELQDCVAYQTHVGSLFLLPTRFALVNNPGVGPQYFGVADQGVNALSQELETIRHVMTNTRPAGPTPLTAQLAGIRNYVSNIAPQLQQARQKVTIVLATQGIPTDQGFVQTLRSLENLPVWIVIRLCTDDENVIDFYNSLDAQLNLPYDVLDDFFGEALEIFLRNPWLTYGLPLHRFREMGFRVDVIDELDERPLNLKHLRELCCLLFAAPTLPDPAQHWEAFMQALVTLVAKEKQQWNPVTRKVCPWINLHLLSRFYGQQSTSMPQSPQIQQGFSQQSAPQGVNANLFGQQQQPYYSNQQHHNEQWQQQQQQSPSSTVNQQKNTAHSTQPHQSHPENSQSAPTPTQTASKGATRNDQNGTSLEMVKKNVMSQWALTPPNYQLTRPVQYLLGTVQNTFPPAFGIEKHDYFDKWKPFSVDALSSGQAAVVKRAIRKTKFFLHPDKLPRDFNERQTLLCKTLWHVLAEAAEAVAL